MLQAVESTDSARVFDGVTSHHRNACLSKVASPQHRDSGLWPGEGFIAVAVSGFRTAAKARRMSKLAHKIAL